MMVNAFIIPKPAALLRYLNERFDYAVECAMPDQSFEVNECSFLSLPWLLWNLVQEHTIIGRTYYLAMNLQSAAI